VIQLLKGWGPRHVIQAGAAAAAAAVLIGVGVAAAPILSPYLASDADVQRRVSAFTSGLPSDLPMRLDRETTWRDWTVEGHTIRYVYELRRDWEAPYGLPERLTSLLCAQAQSRWLLRAGITFSFRYVTRAGVVLTQVDVRGVNCWRSGSDRDTGWDDGLVQNN
jgi:hypothetical protein